MGEKIIRDGLVARIPAIHTRTIKTREEHLRLLSAKVMEERDEIIKADFQDAFEFGDLLQVVMDMAQVAGVSWAAVEEARQSKLKERGGFLGGHVHCPPDSVSQRVSLDDIR